MKAFTLAILPLLIISVVSVSWSQDLSNYYTPYGFRFPSLDKGEYSVSFGTYYNRSNSKYYDPGTDPNGGNKRTNSAITLSGIYGISKTLLFRGSLSFFPSLTSSEYDSFIFDPLSGQIYYYKNKSDLHSYFSPSATFVFRPSSKIELFADFSRYVSKTDRYQISESTTTLQDRLRIEYYNVWVGVNIIGKL
jgi:hypothetical protein